MKHWTRFLAAVLVAALFMNQPGGTVLAGAVEETAAGKWAARDTEAAVESRLEESADRSTEKQYWYDDTEVSITFDPETGTITAFDDPSGYLAEHEILIPESLDGVEVVAIGDGVFANNTSLTSIGGYPKIDWEYPGALCLPEGIREFGERTFYNCENLLVLSLPDNSQLTTIGDSAFENCTKLLSALLCYASGLQAIGNRAFANCESMDFVRFAYELQTLGEGAFSGCASLPAVYLPDGMTSIPDALFDGCSAMEWLRLPETVTHIGDNALRGCASLKYYVLDQTEGFGLTLDPATDFRLPSNLESVGTGAFQGCGALTALAFPKTMQSIGSNAFSDCKSLSRAEIYAPNVEIQNGAFGNAPADFTICGYVNSTAYTYAMQNNIHFEYFLEDPVGTRTLSVAVQAGGQPITDGFTVRWYEDGREAPLPVTGTTLYNAETEKTYMFEVVLGDELAAQYRQPARQIIEPGEEDAAVTVTLEPAAVLTLTGSVQDSTGAPVPNAAVTVIQAGGEEAVTVSAEDGGFSVQIPPAQAQIKISAQGYYSKQFSIFPASDAKAYALGAVALYETVADRIVLEVTVRHAAAEGEPMQTSQLYDMDGLEFTLTGADNRPISGFEVQGTAIIFQPDAVEANEKLSISAYDREGRYESAEAAATLNEDKIGSVQLELVENGHFVLGEMNTDAARLLIFGQDGALLRSMDAYPGMQSGPMQAGSYTMVFLEKNSMLPSAANLDMLDALGVEYARSRVEIAAGEVARLTNINVPALELGALLRTEEGTGLTVSTQSPALGTQFYLRADYELSDPAASQADCLQLGLPEGVSLVNGRIFLNGEAVSYTEDAASGMLSVPLNGQAGGSVIACCTATEAGEHDVNAYLRFHDGAVQPIGTVRLTAGGAEFDLPRKTAGRSVTITGTALPHSTVTIYDNGEKLETERPITANALGSWSAKVALHQDPDTDYAYHKIHAVIQSGDVTVQTESKLLTYDAASCTLSKITVYNTYYVDGTIGTGETVLDFTSDSTEEPFYYYWPTHMNFTFKVEFDGAPDAVSVVTEGKNGEIIRIPAAYDGENGCWIAAYEYDSSNVPVAVGAEYDTRFGSMALDAERYEAEAEAVADECDQLADALENDFFENVGIENITESGDTVAADLTLTNTETGQTQVFGRYRAEEQTLEDDVTRETLSGEGYSEVESLSGEQVWVKADVTDHLFTETIVDLDTKTRLIIQMELENIGEPDQPLPLSRSAATFSGGIDTERVILNVYKVYSYWETILDLCEWVDKLGKVPVSDTWQGKAKGIFGVAMEIWENNKTVREWYATLEGHMSTLTANYNDAVSLLNARCEDGSLRLPQDALSSLEASLEAIYMQITDLDLTVRQWIRRVGVSACITTAVSAPGKVLMTARPGISLAVGMGELIYDLASKEPIGEYMDATFENINEQLRVLWYRIPNIYQSCKDKDDNKDNDPDIPWDDIQKRQLKPAYDPSGYVYEAVPSNRLEGVTATVYQQGSDAAWDAADYNQINPQVTNGAGMYAWFVPDGNWKVTFTKDGYVPADSSGVAAAVENGGWLPVPPPQFEVNVGMESTAPPAVERAIAYNDRIEVAFSQYMDIASARKAISLSQDGQPVTITVAALDAEDTLDGSTQYAARFSVTPEDGDCTGTIAVSTDAQNYAGTALEEGYTAALAAPVQRPAGIAASGQTTVVYKETAALTLTLQPGIAGKALEVEELTPSLLSADETTVTTDAYGAAVVTLTGLLPGSGLIRITEPESGLSEIISVQIVMSEEELGEAEKPAPVTAALSDGTPVTTGMTLESGAQITLRTATEGAVIRYTLDDTCPCRNEALTYAAPITMTENTVLRAAALLDGVYSDTIRLELMVSGGTEEPEQPDDPGGSGGSGGGSSSGGGQAADDRPSVSTNGEGGTVTAGKGTVTIKPDEGYQIGSVTVNGEAVEIPSNGILKGLDAGDEVVVSFERIPEEAGLPFTDVVPGSWYCGAVQYVCENGMMNGTGGRLFSPNSITSRAMIVTILHRMEGAPAASASSFTDIAAGAYYENAVNWAAENGIVSGASKTSFLPDDPVTREQLAVILYRYAQYKSYDVTGSTDLSAYTDAAQIDACATDAMQWANENGLITGNTSTTLNPKGHTTRAEAATVLMRFCQNIAE